MGAVIQNQSHERMAAASAALTAAQESLLNDIATYNARVAAVDPNQPNIDFVPLQNDRAALAQQIVAFNAQINTRIAALEGALKNSGNNLNQKVQEKENIEATRRREQEQVRQGEIQQRRQTVWRRVKYTGTAALGTGLAALYKFGPTCAAAVKQTAKATINAATKAASATPAPEPSVLSSIASWITGNSAQAASSATNTAASAATSATTNTAASAAASSTPNASLLLNTYCDATSWASENAHWALSEIIKNTKPVYSGLRDFGASWTNYGLSKANEALSRGSNTVEATVNKATTWLSDSWKQAGETTLVDARVAIAAGLVVTTALVGYGTYKFVKARRRAALQAQPAPAQVANNPQGNAIQGNNGAVLLIQNIAAPPVPAAADANPAPA